MYVIVIVRGFLIKPGTELEQVNKTQNITFSWEQVKRVGPEQFVVEFGLL